VQKGDQYNFLDIRDDVANSCVAPRFTLTLCLVSRLLVGVLSTLSVEWSASGVTHGLIHGYRSRWRPQLEGTQFAYVAARSINIVVPWRPKISHAFTNDHRSSTLRSDVRVPSLRSRGRFGVGSSCSVRVHDSSLMDISPQFPHSWSHIGETTDLVIVWGPTCKWCAMTPPSLSHYTFAFQFAAQKRRIYLWGT